MFSERYDLCENYYRIEKYYRIFERWFSSHKSEKVYEVAFVSKFAEEVIYTLFEEIQFSIICAKMSNKHSNYRYAQLSYKS